jgi:hypothetical protein
MLDKMPVILTTMQPAILSQPLYSRRKRHRRGSRPERLVTVGVKASTAGSDDRQRPMSDGLGKYTLIGCDWNFPSCFSWHFCPRGRRMSSTSTIHCSFQFPRIAFQSERIGRPVFANYALRETTCRSHTLASYRPLLWPDLFRFRGWRGRALNQWPRLRGSCPSQARSGLKQQVSFRAMTLVWCALLSHFVESLT